MVESRFVKFYKSLNTTPTPAKKKQKKVHTAAEKKAIIEKNKILMKEAAKERALKLEKRAKKRAKKRLLKTGSATPKARPTRNTNKVITQEDIITAGWYQIPTSTIRYFFKSNGNAKFIFNNGREDIVVPLCDISYADEQKIWAKLTRHTRGKRPASMHCFKKPA